MQAPVPSTAANTVLLREDAGSIAVLTLNRPQARNSLSEDLLAALSETFAAIGVRERSWLVLALRPKPARTERERDSKKE